MSAENESNVIDLKKTKKKRNKLKKKEAKLNSQKAMKSGDFWLIALVLSLTVFGIIMVFSASYYYAISKYDDPYYFLKRDAIYSIIGAVAFFALGIIDYHRLRKGSFLLLLVSIGLLILLLFPSLPFVVSINGQARWISMVAFTIMPGEIAKPAVILFVSAWLSRKPGMILKFKEGILPVAIVAVIVGVLIGLNNAITAATVLVIIAGIMFIAGLEWKYLIAAGTVGVLGATGLVIVEPYRLKRVTSFIDPFSDPQGSGYQVIQGLLALGSGGLFGLGLGKSVQKTLYLPEPQNDFIYAIIGEELGLVGLLCLLMVYLLLIWRCIHISMNAPDMFGTLLGSGVTIMLAVQVILNIMVVTSIFPPTGIILPFVSWGGSALVIFMGCMGIMLNISRQTPR